MYCLNCSQCKAEGLASLYLSGEEHDCAVFITTKVLSVGINVSDIDAVIDFPCPLNPAVGVKHAGCPACDREQHGEAIICVKNADIDTVTSFIELDEYMEDPHCVVDFDDELGVVIDPDSATVLSFKG